MQTATAGQGAARTPLARFFASTLGRKAVMALTGVVMFGFLIGHLAGNLLMFAGKNATGTAYRMDEYAAQLHSMPALVWGTRVVLLLSVAAHIWAALSLASMSSAARPVAYKVVKTQQATLASKFMKYGGFLIFAFIVYHLLHFTVGVAHHDFKPGQVYANVVAGFSQPGVSGAYAVAMVSLCLHLYHGLYSFFLTMGFNHPTYTPRIRAGAQVVAVALAAGFLSIPVAVLAGVIKA